MSEQELFREILRETAELAKRSEKPLTRKEIRGCFGDIELTKEQEDLVFQYLKEAQKTWKEQPQTVQKEPGKKQEKKSTAETTPKSSSMPKKDSVYHQMYLQEAKHRSALVTEQEQVMYKKLAAGDEGVIHQIVDFWLVKIIELAKSYRFGGVNIEDLIQEGNMGLWMALSEASGNIKAEEAEAYLLKAVRESMEEYIRDTTGDSDRVQAVLGKAALLHEAQELLTQENSREPSLRELSEYTHIAPEEIRDILAITRPVPGNSEDS